MREDETRWVILECSVCGNEIQGVETQSGAGWVIDHVFVMGEAWCAKCWARRTGHNVQAALHDNLRSRPMGKN